MSTLKIRSSPDDQQNRVQTPRTHVDFGAWIKISEEIDSELVRGVVIERMAAQYPHEWILAWLHTILFGYVYNRGLGKVLGSRSAVKITDIDGRLPDILFVRAENEGIIRDDAIYGAPDLVIEIISENDRPGYLGKLEHDYRSVGVSEIVFIDPSKKRIKYLRRIRDEYGEEFLSTGSLKFAAIPGFSIEVEWLFASDRPDPFTVTKQIIESAAQSGTRP